MICVSVPNIVSCGQLESLQDNNAPPIHSNLIPMMLIKAIRSTLKFVFSIQRTHYLVNLYFLLFYLHRTKTISVYEFHAFNNLHRKCFPQH